MVYQLMFAIITPALISGAFAERMKFSGHAAVHDPMVDDLYSHGSHGLGQGRFAERFSGRTIPRWILPAARWCTLPRASPRWYARSYLGKRLGYPKESDAAAQRGAELHWRLPAVGGLVWIQCGQRAFGRQSGDQRVS